MDKTSYRVLTLTVGCMLLLSTTAQQVIAWPCRPPGEPCDACYTCTETGCECLAECGCGGRTCPDCWDCVDVSCECECDITINSVSSDDYACIDCDVTFTADVSGNCSCVDWSGGGSPPSQNGGCKFITQWDTAGPKKVTATPDCGDSEKEKQVTIVDVEIEADVKDEPPPEKTYASGINENSIVLKLNGIEVTPTITDITNGKHIYYKPACSELNLPGNNTVELKVRDNANAGKEPEQDINDAGNPTSPDPFTWSFTLP